MKDLMSLWRVLAHEAASRCDTSATLDLQYVEGRVKTEGESFFTITLPQFGKDFLRGLELEQIDSTLFRSFKKRAGLPAFLQGFLSQVFTLEGTLLDKPNIECIDAVHQLCSVFGKIERPCTEVRTARAMKRFVEIEAELSSLDSNRYEGLLPQFQLASKLLWADVMADVERKLLGRTQLSRMWPEYSGTTTSGDTTSRDPFLDLIDAALVRPGTVIRPLAVQGMQKLVSKVVDPPCGDVITDEQWLVPRHGPGATADRLRGNAKYDLVVWPQRLERVFPYGDYALPMLADNNKLDRVTFLEPGSETPVKVVAVPKTLKTPRIIAEEPTAMQYMQQALSHELVTRLENSWKSRMNRVSPHVRTQKVLDIGGLLVGFARQEPNRLLAREGSLDGYLASLDLSDASDRVLNRHVELLFARFPRLSEAIQATRSTKADVSGHGIVPLTKFASMGSALTFPIEAMVFTTIVVMAIAAERRVPLTTGFLMSLVGKVRVYGDDIIVPVDCALRVIDYLEAFGLRVNVDKSFLNGKFRESCGGDFYDGEWVTPVRLKKDLPTSLNDVSEVVGLVAFRNLLYWKGYWSTARHIDKRLNSLFRGNYPVVDVTAAGLGRESVLYTSLRIAKNNVQKIDFKHQTYAPLVLGARVIAPIPRSTASGEGLLMKFLIKRGSLPFLDPKHFERQGRPNKSRIKIGWMRPY